MADPTDRNLYIARVTEAQWGEIIGPPSTLADNTVYIVKKDDTDILEVYLTYPSEDGTITKRLLNEYDAAGIATGVLLSTNQW